MSGKASPKNCEILLIVFFFFFFFFYMKFTRYVFICTLDKTKETQYVDLVN